MHATEILTELGPADPNEGEGPDTGHTPSEVGKGEVLGTGPAPNSMGDETGHCKDIDSDMDIS